MDTIELDGMEFYGYHGCNAEERERGQRFLVDLLLRIPLGKAGGSDALEDTVNYAAVFEEVRAVVEGEPRNLLESVAERIANSVLDAHPLVESLRVTVHKPDAPLPGTFRDAAVSVERGR